MMVVINCYIINHELNFGLCDIGGKIQVNICYKTKVFLVILHFNFFSTEKKTRLSFFVAVQDCYKSGSRICQYVYGYNYYFSMFKIMIIFMNILHRKELRNLKTKEKYDSFYSLNFICSIFSILQNLFQNCINLINMAV